MTPKISRIVGQCMELEACARSAHQLTSPRLVEHEQRVVAGTAEMTVVGAAFLLAIGRALARTHVENDRQPAYRNSCRSGSGRHPARVS
jgi:hypothetical protein